MGALEFSPIIKDSLEQSVPIEVSELEEQQFRRMVFNTTCL